MHTHGILNDLFHVCGIESGQFRLPNDFSNWKMLQLSKTDSFWSFAIMTKLDTTDNAIGPLNKTISFGHKILCRYFLQNWWWNDHSAFLKPTRKPYHRLNSLNTRHENIWIFKQSRSRWGGSSWLIMSHLIKIYNVCPLVFEFSIWYCLDLTCFEKLQTKITNWCA